MESSRDFGSIAKGLARNPLGIIALFIVLVYGFAALVTAFASNLTLNERLPLIYFLVLFPIIVLSVFYRLVSKHSGKLFAPIDVGENNFVTLQLAWLQNEVKGIKDNTHKRERSSERAMQVIYEIINDRGIYSVEDIIEVFSQAPKDIAVHAYGYLESIRKQSIFNLLDHELDSPDKLLFIRNRFERFLPLMEGLLQLEKKDGSLDALREIHYYYASLSYLYKDKKNPDWEKALRNISKAVETHKKAYPGEKVLTVYLFNLLICEVNSNSSSDKERKNALAMLLNQGGNGLDMLESARECIAPNVRSWVKYNGKELVEKALSKLTTNEKDYWEQEFNS